MQKNEGSHVYGSDTRLGLSEFLAVLVAELSEAQSQTEKDELNYVIDEVRLELDIVYTLTQSDDTPTKVRPQLWVLQGGSREGYDASPTAQSGIQHLILRLTPQLGNVRAGKSEDVRTVHRLPLGPAADSE